jgi:predicted glutamine amidotransferase
VWGVGYYAEDRALIIRKPAELLTTRSAFELAPNVQSSIVLACVKRDVKALEQAPPHRFRNWLFGYCGDLSSLSQVRARVVDRLPDFVLPEIGDSTGGSLAFGMFIGELHRTGLLLDPLATHSALAQAMHRTADAVRMLAVEAGVEEPKCTYVATNGRVVIASRAGASLFTKTQEGLESSPHGPQDPSLGEFKRLAEALKRFRAMILTQNVAQGRTGWSEVQEGSTIFFDRKLGMQKV